MAPVVVFPLEARVRRWVRVSSVPSPSEARAARRGPVTGSSADAAAAIATTAATAVMFAIGIRIAASREVGFKR